MTKVIVTGGSGLLGKSLKSLTKENDFEYHYLSSTDYELMDSSECNDMFNYHRPDYVLHFAGVVGGIKDNVARPYDFIFQNISINTNIINSCVQRNIPLLCASSTCV